MLLRIHSISSFLIKVFQRITLLGFVLLAPHNHIYCIWMKITLEGLGSFVDDNVDIYFTIISATNIQFSPRKRTQALDSSLSLISALFTTKNYPTINYQENQYDLYLPLSVYFLRQLLMHYWVGIIKKCLDQPQLAGKFPSQIIESEISIKCLHVKMQV